MAPDRATQKGLQDYTGKAARHRVLYVNLLFIKYGTSDKTHAAAIVLSAVLLFALLGLIFLGTRHGDAGWEEKAFSWLSGAFLFIAGVAIGKGGFEDGRTPREDEEE